MSSKKAQRAIMKEGKLVEGNPQLFDLDNIEPQM
jgi:hypothetical protein